MGIIEQVVDEIQKKGGELIQALLKDLKVKSFHGLEIQIGDTTIKPPKISIKSDNFKIKVIDKSNGKAISDIPIPIDINIDIPEIAIAFKKPIKIIPGIDIMLGNKK